MSYVKCFVHSRPLINTYQIRFSSFIICIREGGGHGSELMTEPGVAPGVLTFIQIIFHSIKLCFTLCWLCESLQAIEGTKINQYLQKKPRILFLGSHFLCKSLTKIQTEFRNNRH